MAERIVVCCWTALGYLRTTDTATRLGDAQLLMQHAQVLGAALCGWSAASLSFAFHPDDLEEVIGFVTQQENQRLLAGHGIGVSQGELMAWGGRRGEAELAWGVALARAEALAETAAPGEILVDCDMTSVYAAELVTRGVRVARTDAMTRGYVLDADEPWRAQSERAVERLVEPALVGHPEVRNLMAVVPGTVATLRADAGTGGTRLLRVCAEQSAPARTLFLQPCGHGAEPLGSLRRALLHSQTAGTLPSLPADVAATLERIVSGQGADIAAAAKLVERVLGDKPTPGLLLIDDATEVDESTLDAVATALLGAARPFRAIARLDASSPLPALLAPLPPGPEVEIGALSRVESERLAAAWTGGTLRDDAMRAWAQRGNRLPLGIVEAIAEGLASGELAWRNDRAYARTESSPSSEPMAPGAWMQRRLRLVPPSARAVLFSLAVLGGEAPLKLIKLVHESVADVPGDVEEELAWLTRHRWAVSNMPGWWALTSRTLRRVLLQSLPEAKRGMWYRAGSRAVQATQSGLALAEASWLAAAGQDAERARDLANEASLAARHAGLTGAASMLSSFSRAQHQDRSKSEAPSVLPPEGTTPRSMLPDASTVATHLVARTNERTDDWMYPPVDIADLQPAALQALVRPTVPRPPRVPKDLDIDEAAEDTVRVPAPVVMPKPDDAASAPDPELKTDTSGRMRAVNRMASELPVIGREVLLSGDRQAVERWVQGLGQRERLVQRMRAIVALRHGDTNEALRTLREACAQSRNLGPVERSRSHLAYAVALAQTGRANDALVEALEALARAREAADPKGEKACAVFLYKLYVSAGQEHAAEPWKALATG